MRNKRLKLIFLFATALLLVSLVAMQFTDEVDWQGADFVMASVWLFGGGGLVELAMRKTKNRRSRMVWLSIVLVVIFLVWIEMAVGVFETPLAGS